MILALLDSLRHARRRTRLDAAQAPGRRGEDLAHRFLRRQGFVIVARNYRLPTGGAEADLIAWEGDKLVIVEVKSRDTGDFGPPERAIGEEKRHRLLRLAREYALRAAVPWERVRFDVVTVVLTNPPEITLFRGFPISA